MTQKKIDVLWLVEHIAREMDVACAVKTLVEDRYGLNITIRNLYLHAQEVVKQYQPAVVVHPFFYFLNGALATEDFVKTWPEAIHFNLAWEEIHYKAHLKIKAPSDEFTQKAVLHHAWGNFYKEYLLASGVPAEHIFVNGQPAYQLYRPPYNQYYHQREWLAERYGLDNASRWIFVPENYRWAFLGSKINLFTKLGGDRQEMLAMQEFSIASLRQLMQWCNETARHEHLELIFRPRPATNSQLMQEFFKQNVGQAAPRLNFIKGETVREWILASDIVFSSYSTSLIEAAVANKPIYMVEPLPIPESLYCDWYQYLPRIYSKDDFETACLKQDGLKDAYTLKSWAEKEMLAHGDPIEGLVDFIKGLVDSQPQKLNSSLRPVNKKFGLPAISVNPKEIIKPKEYFNQVTHENDVFDETDVQFRVAAWRKVLLNQTNSEATLAWQPNTLKEHFSPMTTEIINKTMDRQDLLTPDAQAVVQDLNNLIHQLYAQKLYMSSWVGTLPTVTKTLERSFINKILGSSKNSDQIIMPNPGEAAALERGMEQRLDYKPLPGAADDLRIPWFLYWETYWVLKITKPYLQPGMRLFDGGGTSSLFTCYLSSLGYEIHAVDLNEKLNTNGAKIARASGWNMYSYAMDMQKLDFPDQFFDHAYSICVFEHLDFDIKQAALAEIARCLKPGGILSITFDYRNPAPGVVGFGKDTRPRNQLKTEEDIHRNFLSTGHYELVGNEKFYDNGESYLVHHRFDHTPYTFGAIFLRKKG